MKGNIMTIAICDDDEMFLESMKERIIKGLNRLGREDVSECDVFSYTSGEMLLEQCIQDHIDIVFVDIELGNELGFDIVKKLLIIKEDMMVVYVSNYDHYVFHSFSCRPFGFIRKQYVESDLERVLLIVCEEWDKRNKVLLMHVKRETYAIKLSKVYVIEMQGHNMCFDMINGNFDLKYPMKKIEHELEEAGFIKIRRGIMVNPFMIVAIKENVVYMRNGKIYPVSRADLKETRKKWMLSKIM